MKIITQIARFLLGLTFVFSGYVKLVDPMGSAIKMEEYLSEGVLNLPFLMPYALPLSILLILAELVLGVSILVGFKPKWTTRATGLLMLVFLFLTWYSAYFDKVTDCGCFGDAITLSPWATFYKNIFFGALAVILIKYWYYITPIKKRLLVNVTPIITLAGGLYISYYVLQHLPLHDFRPYAIGKNISEGMKDVPGLDIPPVHDFILETPEGEDLTEKVLSDDKVLLIISYNLSYADSGAFNPIKQLTDKALNKSYSVYFLTASYVDDFEDIKKQYKWDFNMLYADETTLKTMIRANPGVMLLNKGTVSGKWNWKDIRNIAL